MSPASALRNVLRLASAGARAVPRAPPRSPARTLAPGLALSLAIGACSGPADEPVDRAADDTAAVAGTAAETGGDASTRERPETVTDSIRIEGMAEEITLRLFRSPRDFPLPFSTYVPADMTARADPGERTAHFTAVFGGTRNEDAFMHFYLFPEGTPLQKAMDAALGYKTGRGVPVGRGLEPIADQLSPPDLDWAIEAYRFLYEAGGEWYAGTLGVGERDGRYYMIVQHYPSEYGDGFAPRAALIVERWRWEDGAPLESSAG